MGVQGLWQLLHPAGKPVAPSSLEGKVLAVDVSIWLHQTMKGMRDRDGNPLPNAHLQGLFSRVCKLLFYRIRPVFVFDGGVPALKKQTMAIRRERKENVEREKGRMNRKILENLLQSHAVGSLTGDRTDRPNMPSKRTELDLFELPPLPETEEGLGDQMETGSLWEADADLRAEHRHVFQSFQEDLQNLEEVDTDSPEFQSLPPEIRHEILSEMKEQRRETALARIAIMPEDSKDFSDYQLQKLIKQSRLSGQIDSLRKEMNQRVSGDITYTLGDNYYGELVEANRVVSEDAAHYVLIKGLTRKQQIAEAERCKERRLNREKKELERNPEKKKEMAEPEIKSENGDTFGSQDEAEMEEEIKDSEKTYRQILSDDKGSKRTNRQILSDDDDDEMSDEPKRKKSRRERRGKSLVTRTGLRNVSKKGRCLSAVEETTATEEQVPLTDMASGDQISVPSAANESGCSHETDNAVVKADVQPKGDDKNLPGITSPGHVKTSPTPANLIQSPVNANVQSVSSDSLPADIDSVPVEAFSVPSRTLSTMAATDTMEVEPEDQDGTEDSLKTTENSCSRRTRSTQLKDNAKDESAGCVKDADDVENITDNLPGLNTQTPGKRSVTVEEDSHFTNMMTYPSSPPSDEESDFTETQNRLLKEEEDLNKAKEDKMAALLKTLEKRRQAIQSVTDQTSPSTKENLSHQQRQQILLKEEENLMKEKEKKMAALLQAVEKRSGLQAESVPESSDTAKDSHTDDVKKGKKRKKTKRVSRGFLEDVADLERKTVERKLRGRSTRQAVSSEQTLASSSSSQAAPSLTLEYLEDIESMAELDSSKNTHSDGDVLNSKSSAKETLHQDSDSLLPSLRCDESFKEERKPTKEKLACAKKDILNFDSKQEEMKSEDSEQQETYIADVKVQERKMVSEETKAIVSDSAEKAGSRKESREQRAPSLEEREESEDEGFIEVTIDPSKAPEDNLFPASIFMTDSPPNDTGFPDNTSELQITKIQQSGSNTDSDSVKQISGSDSLQKKRKVHEDETLEPQTVGGADVNLSNHEDVGRASLQVIEVDEESDDSAQDRRISMESAKADISAQDRRISMESANSDMSAQDRRISMESGNSDTGSRKRRLSLESTKSEGTTTFSKGVSSLSDLYELQRGLSIERRTLTLERGRQARLGKSVTEQINLEAQELLQLFGVPYMVSPMEAEAQCASLELIGLTQGTVTDDSDAWLFGASRVYKNFFNNAKYVEFYSADAVCQRFGLDRRKLINVALLCGSDYTPGIPGVGPVRAMEIMAEFPGDGLDGLKAFRNWWEDAQLGLLPRSQGKIRNKLRSLELHEGFPSRQVVDAYLRPEVDESDEAFSWGLPDLDLLEQYAKKKFGWGKQKTDEILQPMMKKLTKKMSQGRIHTYFQPENFVPAKPVKSKRLQQALDKFQKQENSDESESSESGSSDSESSNSESPTGSESDESQPALPKPGESLIQKANQILSGSPGQGRGRGQGRSQGRGTGRGKSNQKPGAQQSKGKDVAARGTKDVMSSTRGGKSSTPGAENLPKGRGRRGGRGRAEQDSKRQSSSFRGSKHQQPAQRKKVVLKDEVSLSESSSSSDNDEPKPKKHKPEPIKSAATKLQQKQQPVSASTTKKSTATAKKSGVAPNVKKLTPTTVTKLGTQKRKLPSSSRAPVPLSKEDSATLKEAMGGDLDPAAMTLDDLGSDFSEDELQT